MSSFAQQMEKQEKTINANFRRGSWYQITYSPWTASSAAVMTYIHTYCWIIEIKIANVTIIHLQFMNSKICLFWGFLCQQAQ